MADEFFRPYFSQGVFGQGILFPRLQYRWMVGNNNSNLDIPASKLDRDHSFGFAITWLPTTGEFGPRGAFGDYERHKKLATRFNLAYTFSPEERQSPVGTPADNTTLRLADSLNVFDTGALATGVTVEKVHYKMVSASFLNIICKMQVPVVKIELRCRCLPRRRLGIYTHLECSRKKDSQTRDPNAVFHIVHQ
jgi:hypothetical protein